MYECMYVYTYKCLYVCMYVCMCMYMYICIHMYVHSYMYTQPCVCILMDSRPIAWDGHALQGRCTLPLPGYLCVTIYFLIFLQFQLLERLDAHMRDKK